MAEEQKSYLVDLDKYLKVGLHIGTKYRTKYMANFIYKIRPDGLCVLNVQRIDERLGLLAKFLANYDPKDILVVGRRENSWDALQMFNKLTGIKVLIGRYPPGLMTNIDLDTFTETKLMVVTDPWPDKNAVNDAFRVGIPIIGLCDTNNESNYLDLVVPCNNKGKKSLGLFYWILAKEFLKLKGIIKTDGEMKVPLEDAIKE